MNKIQFYNPSTIVKIMFLLLFFFIQVSSYSQNKTIDSLLLSLKKQIPIVQEIDNYNELAWQYRDVDISKAFNYAFKAKQMSDSLSYEAGYITSLNRIGVLYINERSFKKAEKLYKTILEREIIRKDTLGIIRAENQLGIIYRESGDYNEAIIHGKNSLLYLKGKGLGELKQMASVYNNLGTSYKYIGDYKNAQNAYIESLKIRESIKDTSGIASSHLSLGNFYLSTENYELALNHFTKSERLYIKLKNDFQLSKIYNNLGIVYVNKNNLEEASYYYQKCLSLKIKLNADENLDVLYNNLGIVSEKKGKLDKALSYYQKSLDIKLKNGLNTTAEVYNNIANVLKRKKDYKGALNYYQKSLEEAKNNNNITLQLKVIDNISKVYAGIKQYDQSNVYNSQYNTLRDSIEINYKSAMEIRLLYEQEKKRAELLEKDNEINQANSAKFKAQSEQKNTLIIALFTGVFLLGLLYAYSRRVIKQKQNIDDLLKDQEIKSINTMITTQDSERKRIATELHDNLGSKLSVVKIHFKTVEDYLEQLAVDNVNNYHMANDLLDDACEEIRKIAYNMSKGILSNFNLVTAVEDLITSIGNSNQIDVEFVASDFEAPLESKTALHLYRILQELISNILRHSKATELTVQILKNSEGLNLMVIDNGIGFSLQRVKKGMGLQSIKTRVEELQGELDIDSGKGNGTTITIQIPIDE